MPRRPLIKTNEFPFHITNRSNNKEYFYLPLNVLWDIMVDKIQYLEQRYQIKTYAFLLMSNHYHWVLSTPQLKLSEGMTYFHREVAKQSNRKCGRVNHFFGGRYKWSLIQEEVYYWHCIKYVFRNPVKAKICRYVQDYQYSSLKIDSHESPWRIVDFFHNPESKVALDLDWLNEPFLNEQYLSIQKGMRRRVFNPPCDKNRNRICFEMPRYKKELGTD